MIQIAGAAIIKDSKILLLQQNSDGDQPDLWGPPAGHAEKDESLIDTAIRETKEETGLNIQITSLVQAGYLEYKNNEYVLAFYNANFMGKIKVQESEAQNHTWASLEEIENDKYPLRKKFLKEPMILALKGQKLPLNAFKIFNLSPEEK